MPDPGQLAADWHWWSAGLAALAALAFVALRERRRRARWRQRRLDVLRRRRLRLRQGLAEQQQLRQSQARQSAFLAAVAHDLRQPLHAIGLLLSTLERRLTPGATEGQHNQSVASLLVQLNRSMLGVDDQVNRLLDLSRLQGGTIQPMWSDVAIKPLLQSLEARFAPLAEMRGLRFKVFVRQDLYVHSDPALLVEIMMNLLSNAFRYTEKGSIAMVVRPAGADLVIQVRDSGPGMRPYAATGQSLLPPAEQAPTGLARGGAHALGGGLGLGLSIVAHLGQAMNMPIQYRSGPARGTCFSLRLPRNPGGAPASGKSSAPDALRESLRGTMVLVIDDDLDVLMAMDSALKACAMFVLVARSLKEALHVIERSERFPDALITDHQVGDMLSGRIIAELRRAVPTPLPAVVITGDTSVTTLDELRQQGHAVLIKPVSLERLMAGLAQLIRGTTTPR